MYVIQLYASIVFCINYIKKKRKIINIILKYAVIKIIK